MRAETAPVRPAAISEDQAGLDAQATEQFREHQLLLEQAVARIHAGSDTDNISQGRESALSREVSSSASTCEEHQQLLEQVVSQLNGAPHQGGVHGCKDAQKLMELDTTASTCDGLSSARTTPTTTTRDLRDEVPEVSPNVPNHPINKPTGLNIISPYSHFARIVTDESEKSAK